MRNRREIGFAVQRTVAEDIRFQGDAETVAEQNVLLGPRTLKTVFKAVKWKISHRKSISDHKKHWLLREFEGQLSSSFC